MKIINFKNINNKFVNAAHLKPKVKIINKNTEIDNVNIQHIKLDNLNENHSTINKVDHKVVKIFINNDNRKWNTIAGYYSWHQHASYKLNNATINITDNVGGCGVQQLYGWGNSYNNSENEELLKYVMNDLHHGVGIVLCQVGSDFYNSKFCKALEKFGFKYNEEYVNHQHSNGDTGRIYTLIIEK